MGIRLYLVKLLKSLALPRGIEPMFQLGLCIVQVPEACDVMRRGDSHIQEKCAGKRLE
jgi:hypothetical protein